MWNWCGCKSGSTTAIQTAENKFDLYESATRTNRAKKPYAKLFIILFIAAECRKTQKVCGVLVHCAGARTAITTKMAYHSHASDNN